MDKDNHNPIVEINGTSLFHNVIDKVLINRFAFLNIPLVEVVCSIADEALLEILLVEKSFRAGFSYQEGNRELYDFYLTDIVSLSFHSEKETVIHFKGLLDVRDFLNTPVQISFAEHSSSDVLALLQTVLPDIQYEGDDIQTWLSYNIPEIQFAKELIAHSYIAEDDFAVPYLGLNRELVVKPYSDIIADTNVFKVTDTPVAPAIKFFTNDYLNTFNLEEAKGFKELNYVNALEFIPKTSNNTNNIVTTDVISGKSYIIDQKINIGNVHPMFYKQEFINSQSLRFLQKYMISFSYDTLITDDILPLLSQLEFDLSRNTSSLFKKNFTLIGVTKFYIKEGKEIKLGTSLIGGRGDLL